MHVNDPLGLIGTAMFAVLGCLVVYRARQYSEWAVSIQRMWKWRTKAFYLWGVRLLGAFVAIYSGYEFIKLTTRF